MSRTLLGVLSTMWGVSHKRGTLGGMCGVVSFPRFVLGAPPCRMLTVFDEIFGQVRKKQTSNLYVYQFNINASRSTSNVLEKLHCCWRITWGWTITRGCPLVICVTFSQLSHAIKFWERTKASLVDTMAVFKWSGKVSYILNFR